ncbi:alanine racemase [Gluconacetobacter tumulisoli]|uniref:Alanine racemase n=1 Tax=Gluconacetobacter tumulisoli TaxID=1286189 RepID=A0A7W4PN31_9PROT|nr:alanine racemase [Gluconacetobacter tumulisoli]MBB2200441.1 alanine racemase [Gluconacetobacter tumulisoli]
MLTAADPPAAWAGGLLTIDLGAIAANYRLLRDRVGPDAGSGATCAAAVKADAYGLGAERVVPVLAAAGCRTFFVAHLAEGAAIRPLLGADSTIFVLNGAMPGTEADVHRLGLVPVLNSVEQITRWQSLARRLDTPLPAALQVDSGMSRFGLSGGDLDVLMARPAPLAGIVPLLVMSHLACADDPAHPANHAQRTSFLRLRERLPRAPASLAASSGLFLGPDWQFDMVRPGAALYGINPTPGRPNPMRPVVRLQARIVQTRWIGPGTAVGYGAAFIADRPSRIATLAVGYGDGFPRILGARGVAVLPDRPEVALPIIGRISMDCLAVDVTDAGDDPLEAGTALDLIGPHNSLDSVAAAAGTIGYELLTGLGARYHRVHVTGDAAIDVQKGSSV